MNASRASLVSMCVSSPAPYVCGSVARDLADAASPACDWTVLSGGRADAAHCCRYRPTARDVARDQRLRFARMTAFAAAVACLVGVLLALATLFPSGAVAAPAQSVQFEQVMIGEGDTLWGLAEEHPVRGLSTQEVVRLVSDRNDLAGAIIQPGQVILVPAGA